MSDHPWFIISLIFLEVDVFSFQIFVQILQIYDIIIFLFWFSSKFYLQTTCMLF